MLLAYTELMTEREKRVRVSITCEHATSSHGQPVIVLPNGELLNAESWVLLRYRVVNASQQERAMLQEWLETVNFLMQ